MAGAGMDCSGRARDRRLGPRHERRGGRGRAGARGAGRGGARLAVESAGTVDSRLPTAPWTNARAGVGRRRRRLRLPTLPTATTAAMASRFQSQSQSQSQSRGRARAQFWGGPVPSRSPDNPALLVGRRSCPGACAQARLPCAVDRAIQREQAAGRIDGCPWDGTPVVEKLHPGAGAPASRHS
jgi:hypothetical protein